MPRYKLLIIDDNPEFLSSAKTVLNSFEVITATNLKSAKKIITEEFDSILLDLVFDEKKPDELQGMDFLKFITEHYPSIPTIIMTNHSSIDVTVKAIKLGAADFLSKKELDWIEWKRRLENYCQSSTRERESSTKIKELSEKVEQLESKYDETEIIGSSNEIEFVRRRLKDLAENSQEVSILLTGETGTGKNLAVKYFRKFSPRNQKAFKEFSLISLSENILESELFGHIKGAYTGADKDKIGLFEKADGGILFLDEIGDYDFRLQQKIMKFIEDKIITPVGSTTPKKLDVQLIMATNQNLQNLIEEKRFREDLYQRINRVHIELPPLRERITDIKYLADYFFNHFKEKEKTNLVSINTEVYDLLKNYSWPGNVRELQSVIWEACTKARLFNEKILGVQHIRKELFNNSRDKKTKIKFSTTEKIVALELDEIEETLKKYHGDKGNTAEVLGLTRDKLRYKIENMLSKKNGLLDEYPFIKKKYGYLFRGDKLE